MHFGENLTDQVFRKNEKNSKDSNFLTNDEIQKLAPVFNEESCGTIREDIFPILCVSYSSRKLLGFLDIGFNLIYFFFNKKAKKNFLYYIKIKKYFEHVRK